MDADFQVVHAPERSRYELRLGDRTVGFMDMRPQGDVIVIPYVKVDSEFEGQGLGSRLMRGALDDLLAQGKRVIPHCPFAAAAVRRHPRQAELIA
ncbi:MAG: GNAT family N-acetyltransferase [Fimbriimonas sp.]